jgi:sterol 3beta-glucosyltransferase
MATTQPVPPSNDFNLDGNVGSTTVGANGETASAFVMDDGRVNIHLTEKASKLTRHLQELSKRPPVGITSPFGEDLNRHNKKYDKKFESMLAKFSGTPSLNIAIHIVGSRGDVQPFIAIGLELTKPPYSHRVRICTHPVFKDFVEESGLEFFSIGGDPATLMAFMVKNPGLMPGKESWKAGDVGKRRADIAEILEGTWRSCIESGDGMGGQRKGDASNPTEQADRLFIADAIIANPPSFGHLHCAEKLGIPLHMMFT